MVEQIKISFEQQMAMRQEQIKTLHRGLVGVLSEKSRKADKPAVGFTTSDGKVLPQVAALVGNERIIKGTAYFEGTTADSEFKRQARLLIKQAILEGRMSHINLDIIDNQNLPVTIESFQYSGDIRDMKKSLNDIVSCIAAYIREFPEDTDTNILWEKLATVTARRFQAINGLKEKLQKLPADMTGADYEQALSERKALYSTQADIVTNLGQIKEYILALKQKVTPLQVAAA